MTDISVEELLGRRTLIVGDVGAGKTRLTRRLLNSVLGKGIPVTVIDLAPEAVTIDGSRVGGALLDQPDRRVRLLRPKEIKTPRLSASSPDELIEFADYNQGVIEEILEAFIREPSRVLFINDVSMYLQRGDLDRLWEVFAAAETVVANGYLGDRLREDYGTGLSIHERAKMEELAERMHRVIHLEPTSPIHPCEAPPKVNDGE